MAVPKMVKNGFKSDSQFRITFRGMRLEWKTGAVWKDKTRINTIFDQYRNKHARNVSKFIKNYMLIFPSMHSIISLQTMHSSGICFFCFCSLKQPRWQWQEGGISLFLVGFSAGRTVSTCVLSGLLSVSIWASVIFVKQYGQATYGSAESCCKFVVLSGVVKTFLHEGFGQVNVLFPSIFF